jgi:hypothetical protein
MTTMTQAKTREALPNSHPNDKLALIEMHYQN